MWESGRFVSSTCSPRTTTNQPSTTDHPLPPATHPTNHTLSLTIVVLRPAPRKVLAPLLEREPLAKEREQAAALGLDRRLQGSLAVGWGGRLAGLSVPAF